MKFLSSPKWLPDQLLFSNYADVFQVLDLKTYLVNTFLIIIPCIIGNVFTSCLCGYAFGRLNFKYKNMWFAMVIATMMLPGAVTLIPTFMMWNKLGFVNSFVPLIAPAFLAVVGSMSFDATIFCWYPKRIR